MDELFHVSERKSTIGTELRAGLTTFLAMAYIIAVNPAVLSGAGIDAGALACATCLGAGIMTICMGIFANRPLACASGLGVNAMIAGITTTVCGGDWHVAMSVIFLEGVVILLLVLCGLREAIMDAMQQNSYLQREITAARSVYNSRVTQWNTDLFSWPTKMIVAARQGYTTRIPFTASAETREQARGKFF